MPLVYLCISHLIESCASASTGGREMFIQGRNRMGRRSKTNILGNLISETLGRDRTSKTQTADCSVRHRKIKQSEIEPN